MSCFCANFSARARSRAATATISASFTLRAGLVNALGVIRAAPRTPIRTLSMSPLLLRDSGAMEPTTSSPVAANAWVATALGDPTKVLEQQQIEVPAPGINEARVRVE